MWLLLFAIAWNYVMQLPLPLCMYVCIHACMHTCIYGSFCLSCLCVSYDYQCVCCVIMRVARLICIRCMHVIYQCNVLRARCGINVSYIGAVPACTHACVNASIGVYVYGCTRAYILVHVCVRYACVYMSNQVFLSGLFVLTIWFARIWWWGRCVVIDR